MENVTLEQISEGPLLWAITLIAVAWVMFQSIIFLIKSFKAGREMGIPEEKLKIAFKTGTLSAVGPSIVIVTGMISLLITVGGPTALMRLAYVGNVIYELLSVGFATDAYGVEAIKSDMTPKIFATALWCMALGCVGWVLFSTLFTHKLETLRNKMAGGKKALIPIISSAAMLGAYGYFNSGYVVSLNKNTVAIFSGFITMLIIIKIYRKTRKKWLNEWGLSIAMFIGMIIAALV